ncbi:MAG: hypothetical protein D6814_11765 [Calditrichaeota bacterium]|nr:MAG: hypothetical protein D6814_11765 [Calditrichota bacterium]
MEKALAPQKVIESKMKEIIQLGNYEAVFLFSYEGLPLAKVSHPQNQSQDLLAEMSLMFSNVKKMASSLGGLERLKEVFVEGTNHRKVIFRFFNALGNEVVLAAVVPPRKAYRKLTNDLQRLILSLKF